MTLFDNHSKTALVGRLSPIVILSGLQNFQCIHQSDAFEGGSSCTQSVSRRGIRNLVSRPVD
eukprot:scaffold3036_cov117-Cylindrotheca_fusiformis.AAC.7